MRGFILCVMVLVLVGICILAVRWIKKFNADQAAAVAAKQPPPQRGCVGSVLTWLLGHMIIAGVGFLVLFACICPLAYTGIKRPPAQDYTIISDPKEVAKFETMVAGYPTETPRPTRAPEPTPVLGDEDQIYQGLGAKVYHAEDGEFVVNTGDTVFYRLRGSDEIQFRKITKKGSRKVSTTQIGIVCPDDSDCSDKVRKHFQDLNFSFKQLK